MTVNQMWTTLKTASSGTFTQVSAGSAHTCGISQGQVICIGRDSYGMCNGLKPKGGKPRYFLPKDCYFSERELDCKWNMGLFVEAGYVIRKGIARAVRYGRVGKALQSKTLDVMKMGGRVTLGSLYERVSDDALPYGYASFWSRSSKKMSKNKSRKRTEKSRKRTEKSRKRRKILGALHERSYTAKASKSPMADILKKKTNLEAKVDQDRADIKSLHTEMKEIKAQNAELKAHMGTVEGVVKRPAHESTLSQENLATQKMRRDDHPALVQ
jgi:hypothetical protein